MAELSQTVDHDHDQLELELEQINTQLPASPSDSQLQLDHTTVDQLQTNDQLISSIIHNSKSNFDPPPTPAPSPRHTTPTSSVLTQDQLPRPVDIIPTRTVSETNNETNFDVSQLQEILSLIPNLPQESKEALFNNLLSQLSSTDLNLLSSLLSAKLRHDPFQVLPKEISLNILYYISLDSNSTTFDYLHGGIRDILSCSEVCRSWREIVCDQYLWKQICREYDYRETASYKKLLFKKNSSSSSTENNQLQIDNETIIDDRSFTNYYKLFKYHYFTQHNWINHDNITTSHHVSNEDVIVTNVIMSGSYIVIALDNSLIHVFTTATDHSSGIERLYVLRGHVLGVWALSLLNDTLVSCGCDRTVRVWDLSRGVQLFVLEGHSSTVRCVKLISLELAVSGSRD